MMSDDSTSRLLLAIFRHRIRKPDADAGLDRLVALLGGGMTKDEARLDVANS